MIKTSDQVRTLTLNLLVRDSDRDPNEDDDTIGRELLFLDQKNNQTQIDNNIDLEPVDPNQPQEFMMDNRISKSILLTKKGI